LSIKSIIDKHFADNYTYYKSVCKRYYNGRYLAEDLLHELYLKLSNSNPDQIERYHKANKLNCLGLLIIKDLFRHRTQKLFHIDGNTSNLFEAANFEILDFKQVDEEYFQIDEILIDKIKDPKIYNDPYIKMDIKYLKKQFNAIKKQVKTAEIETITR